jgi:hypothetical protein
LWLYLCNAQHNVVGRCGAQDGGQPTRNSAIVSGQAQSNPVKPSQSKTVGLTVQLSGQKTTANAGQNQGQSRLIKANRVILGNGTGDVST